MADTLETLEVEVKHSSTGAASEIQDVADAVGNLENAIKSAMPQLKALQTTLNNVQTSGSSAKTGIGGFFSKVFGNRLNNIGNSFNQGNSGNLPSSNSSGASVNGTGSNNGSNSSAIRSGANSAGNAVKNLNNKLSALKVAFSQVKNTATSVANSALKPMKAVFNSLTSSIKKTFTPLSTFVSSLKRILFYRMIRTIIKEISSAFSEGLENAYNFSSGLSDAVDGRIATAYDRLTNATKTMKNQLGAAFGSLISAIEPVLTKIINLVTSAAETVTQFFASFTGGTYLKATEATSTYADTASDAAKATEEWKNQLLGFDEINRLEEATSTDSGSGSGSSSSPYTQYTVENVDDSISDFVQSLKDAFNNGDWEGLGELIAGKINEWFASIDWEGLGTKIGNAIDGLIRTAYSILKNTDFTAIGTDLAKMVNNAIENIDWTTAGKLFIRKFTALIDLIIGFILELDWDEVANAVGDFFMGAFTEAAEWLSGHDFHYIGETLSDGVIKILDKILEAVDNAPWEEIGEAISDFLDGIDWVGIFTRVVEIIWKIVKGLISGLLDTKSGKVILAISAGILAIKALFAAGSMAVTISQFMGAITGTAGLGSLAAGIGTVVSGVSSALAPLASVIFSPTGLIVMAVIAAVALIIANWDKIKEAAIKLKEKLVEIWNTIKTKSSELWEKTKSIISDKWENMKTVVSTCASVIKDIAIEKFEAIKTSITDKVSELKDKISTKFNAINDSIKSTLDSLKSSASQKLDEIKSNFVEKWDNIKNTLSTTASTFSTIGSTLVNSIKSGFTSAWSSFSSTVSSYMSSLKSTISSTISNVISSASSTISSWASSARSTVSSIYSTVSSAVSSAYSTVSSYVSSAYNTVSSTISSSINKLSSSLTKVSKSSIKSYATGGFPGEGQLFISREDGPELVGQIGNQTAVANNDQIIEGIRMGVFDAVRAAMSNNQFGTPEIINKVYLDSREIRSGQRRLERAAG